MFDYGFANLEIERLTQEYMIQNKLDYNRETMQFSKYNADDSLWTALHIDQLRREIRMLMAKENRTFLGDYAIKGVIRCLKDYLGE